MGRLGQAASPAGPDQAGSILQEEERPPSGALGLEAT